MYLTGSNGERGVSQKSLIYNYYVVEYLEVQECRLGRMYSYIPRYQALVLNNPHKNVVISNLPIQDLAGHIIIRIKGPRTFTSRSKCIVVERDPGKVKRWQPLMIEEGLLW